MSKPFQGAHSTPKNWVMAKAFVNVLTCGTKSVERGWMRRDFQVNLQEEALPSGLFFSRPPPQPSKTPLEHTAPTPESLGALCPYLRPTERLL